MRQDEVLAARLLRRCVGSSITADVGADRCARSTGRRRSGGEVDARELRALQRGVPDLRAGAEDDVDHPCRQSRLLEEPQRVPRRQRLWAASPTVLPINAGDVIRFAPIAVKLNRLIASTKPSSGRVPSGSRRPLRRSAAPRRSDEILGVEAEEVDRLAGRVDLRLVRGLRLVEHGCGVESRAPRALKELGRPEKTATRSCHESMTSRRERPARPRSRARPARRALRDVGEHGRDRAASPRTSPPTRRARPDHEWNRVARRTSPRDASAARLARAEPGA